MWAQGAMYKVGGTVGDLVLQKELSGDGGYAQGPGGVTLPGGATDHGDDSNTRGRPRVGVLLVSGGNEIHGAQPHRGV